MTGFRFARRLSEPKSELSDNRQTMLPQKTNRDCDKGRCTTIDKKVIALRSSDPNSRVYGEYRIEGRIWTEAIDVHSFCFIDYDIFRQARFKIPTLEEAVEFFNFSGETNWHWSGCSKQLFTRTMIAEWDEGGHRRAVVFDASDDFIKELMCDLVADLTSANYIFRGFNRGPRKPYISVHENYGVGPMLKNAAGRTSNNPTKTFIVPDQDPILGIRPGKQGVSEYSKNEVVRAFLSGNASLHAAYLKKSGNDYGSIRFDRGPIAENHIHLHPVPFIPDSSISAKESFWEGGLMRLVEVKSASGGDI